jgi:hypothetical protein
MHVIGECIVEVGHDEVADHDAAITRALQEIKNRVGAGETIFTKVPTTYFAVHLDDMIVEEPRKPK